MNSKAAPLDAAGVEVAVLDVEVPGADRLRPEPVEERHLCTGGDADCVCGAREKLS